MLSLSQRFQITHNICKFYFHVGISHLTINRYRYIDISYSLFSHLYRCLANYIICFLVILQRLAKTLKFLRKKFTAAIIIKDHIHLRCHKHNFKSLLTFTHFMCTSYKTSHSSQKRIHREIQGLKNPVSSRDCQHTFQRNCTGLTLKLVIALNCVKRPFCKPS